MNTQLIENIVRKEIRRQLKEGGMPMGKGEKSNKAAWMLNDVIGLIVRPDLSREARIKAVDILRLVEKDESGQWD